MLPKSENILTPQEYLAQAREHAQLAMISFSHGDVPKYLIQPSADSLYLQYLIQFVDNIAARSKLPEGQVICSLHDAIWAKEDSFPKLSFGRAVGDDSCFLIPDPFYIKGHGYVEDYVFLEKFEIPWEQRKAIGYFRGSSTGGLLTLDRWRLNRRVQLAQLSLRHPNVLDAKITIIVQEEEEGVGAELTKAGLISAFEPPETCVNYRYVIDIDGNANSWGYFLKLAMGSLVFKVESIWEQWFYSWIKPWVHYVPVKLDLSDLVEKIEWARLNDKEAQRIAANGREFARSFTYPRALDYGAEIIAKAIQASNLFRGQNLS